MRLSKIPFIKMHGAGNDFVFISKNDLRKPPSAGLVRLLMDRHFGVGGDQLLYMSSASRSGVRLDIFNSDGSQAEMCGNGVRAVAHYLRDFKGFKDDFVITTKAGPIGIEFNAGRIAVDMGCPRDIFNRSLTVGSKTFRIHGVSMGNPHCVIFVDKVDAVPLAEIGPKIEHHPFFPNRVNVEFVQVINRSRVRARVWERGAGATLACGTGACAIAVASAQAGRTGRTVAIDLPGGTLGVRWAANQRVYLSGPTKIVYQGEFHV